MPRHALLLLPVLLLAGCATARPVIYPNAPSQLAGKPAQDAAVQACIQQADSADLSRGGGDVARSTAGGAVVGSVGGAAAGAVYGNIGRGVGAGAAAGAATGLVRGLFRGNQPSPVYMSYVNRCLADKGYEVVGWQ
jgi:outer membrane lipoprotein SlyB